METPTINAPKSELTTASTGLKFSFIRPPDTTNSNSHDFNSIGTPTQSFSLRQSVTVSNLDEETLEKEVMVMIYPFNFPNNFNQRAINSYSLEKRKTMAFVFRNPIRMRRSPQTLRGNKVTKYSLESQILTNPKQCLSVINPLAVSPPTNTTGFSSSSTVAAPDSQLISFESPEYINFYFLVIPQWLYQRFTSSGWMECKRSGFLLKKFYSEISRKFT